MTRAMGLRILEAGCGRRCQSDTPRDAHVVGLDVDEAGLALNDRLDERIVADIESADLPRDAFDRIVCHDVLEHLARPIVALDNLIGSLAPSGELRLGLPNVASRKSLVAKFTPHSFHVLVYRMLGRENAGSWATRPFRPTFAGHFARLRSSGGLGTAASTSSSCARSRAEHSTEGRSCARLVGSASELRLVLRKPGGPGSSGS